MKNISYEWKVSNKKIQCDTHVPLFSAFKVLFENTKSLKFFISLGKYFFLRWFSPPCGFKRISIILLSCEKPKSECLLLRKYSVWEEINLKKSEAEVNLFPGNFILVQAYAVTWTLSNYHNFIYVHDIKFT